MYQLRCVCTIFGWIKDLSEIDPTSIFNLFGLLPYSTTYIPDFLNIGLWPVAMGLSMFIQQKLNPPPPDPIQGKNFPVDANRIYIPACRLPSWSCDLLDMEQYLVDHPAMVHHTSH